MKKHYHLQIMKELEKGNLDERVLRQITDENQKLIEITKNLTDKTEGWNKDI